MCRHPREYVHASVPVGGKTAFAVSSGIFSGYLHAKFVQTISFDILVQNFVGSWRLKVLKVRSHPSRPSRSVVKRRYADASNTAFNAKFLISQSSKWVHQMSVHISVQNWTGFWWSIFDGTAENMCTRACLWEKKLQLHSQLARFQAISMPCMC